MGSSSRCDVCGALVAAAEPDKPVPICTTCDLKMATIIVRMLLKGHRPPESWKKKGHPGGA